MRITRGGLLLLAYVAFVSLGLPDTVLGVAWPSIRGAFGRAQADLGAVLATGVTGYFVSSAVAGRLASRLGVGRLLAASSASVAVGLAGYAVAPTWWSFVPLALVVGLGSGAVDAAINGYAARHFPVRHVNWLHGCWSIGATTGPVVMTATVASGSFRAGYATLAAAIAVLALAFAITRRAWDGDVAARAAASATSPATTARAALRRGRVWLQIALFFVYTGLESGAGQWCFTVLREARGLGVEAAGSWTAAYWASHTAARFVLGSVVERIGADRMLRALSFTALAAAVVFASSDGLAGRVALVGLGASLGPFFPTLMARTAARLGEGAAAHAVGFQVSAATLGTAVLPGALGLVATWAGVGAIGVAVAVTAAALLILHEAVAR